MNSQECILKYIGNLKGLIANFIPANKQKLVFKEGINALRNASLSLQLYLWQPASDSIK